MLNISTIVELKLRYCNVSNLILRDERLLINVSIVKSNIYVNIAFSNNIEHIEILNSTINVLQNHNYKCLKTLNLYNVQSTSTN